MAFRGCVRGDYKPGKGLLGEVHAAEDQTQSVQPRPQPARVIVSPQRVHRTFSTPPSEPKLTLISTRRKSCTPSRHRMRLSIFSKVGTSCRRESSPPGLRLVHWVIGFWQHAPFLHVHQREPSLPSDLRNAPATISMTP